MKSSPAIAVAAGRVGSSADAEVLVACAAAALRARAHADAFKILDTALLLEPEHVRAWVLLGSCHEQAGRHDSAIEAYSTALALDDRHPAAEMAKARLFALRAANPDPR